MMPKISELGLAKKIVIANVCVAIALSTISLIHTILVVGGGTIEANPIIRPILGANPALAFLIPPSVVIFTTYVAWRYHEYAGISVSSILLGVVAFDFWTHVYLMMVG